VRSKGDGAQSRARSSRIAADRAEILSLIGELSQVRRVRTNQRRFSSRAPARARTASEPPLTKTGMLALVRSLEVRVTLLEERQQRVFRKSSLPAPPVADPPAGYTFSGLIQGQMLSDMLQLVSSNNMSGKFVVQDGRQSSALYFEEGRVCHAEAGQLVGEQAFFAAFAFESGTYHFLETTELPAERTVNSSTQFLILEALRQIDESHAE
jgi:hypothetical protein